MRTGGANGRPAGRLIVRWSMAGRAASGSASGAVESPVGGWLGGWPGVVRRAPPGTRCGPSWGSTVLTQLGDQVIRLCQAPIREREPLHGGGPCIAASHGVVQRRDSRFGTKRYLSVRNVLRRRVEDVVGVSTIASCRNTGESRLPIPHAWRDILNLLQAYDSGRY